MSGAIELKLTNILNPEYTFNLTEFDITAHEVVDNQ